MRVRFIDAVLSTYVLHDNNASSAIEQHMNAGLVTVKKHYEGLSLRRQVDRVRYYHRRAQLFYAGGRSYQNAGQNNMARKCFLKSLKIYPIFWRALAAFFISMIITKRPVSSQRKSVVALFI